MSFICKNNDFNQVLYNACLEGNVELALFMLDKINMVTIIISPTGNSVLLTINNPVDALNIGLYNACRSGNKDLVLLMISKGAKDLLKGLFWSYYSGNKEIIDLLEKMIN